MRIGLFGGTFNPVHVGHLRVALEIVEAFSLDHLYLIPSATPPHKPLVHVADATHRFEMIRLAIREDVHLKISDVELNREGPSYTIDTLKYYRSEYATEDRFFFVMGMDAFLEIETWKSYRELFDYTCFIIVGRPSKISLREYPRKINRFLIEKIAGTYQYVPQKGCFEDQKKETVYFWPVTQLDVSSTYLRTAIGRGNSIRYLVPEVVEKYIKKKALYLK